MNKAFTIKLIRSLENTFMTKKTYSVSFCNNYLYNSVGFERNYFVAVNCSWYSTNYQTYCNFCTKLRNSLNYKVKKVCVHVNNIKKVSFKTIPMEDHLYKHIKVFAFLFLIL